MDTSRAGVLFRAYGARLAVLRRSWHLLSAEPVAVVSLLFLFMVVVFGLLASRISPYGPNDQDISARLLQPSLTGGHLLGTDGLGRDVLSRLMYGTRMALLIPLVGVAISLVLGVTLGLVAGYYGGKADAIIMRIVDIKMALSSNLLILVIIVMIGPGPKTIMLVFGLVNWVLYARMVRGAILSLRETPFVQAARIIGCSNRRVMFAHVMPSMVAVIVSVSIVEMAKMMITESGLSFLGFGVQPPTVTWGLMLAAGREYLNVAWWLVTFPGLMISGTVLAISLVGIWLRAVTDPFQRNIMGMPRKQQ
ncbi:MAG: ABC transporter permease [Chloroflexi bacterium]|nr:ABC transporter permease [Chloroflexota bacterium]